MVGQETTVPTRAESVRRARERGLAVVAALPYHYPRAVLRAHRCHAVEVWAPSAAAAVSGSRHFQAYTCSIVSRGTAFLLDGGARQVDAILVPHGCDSLQGMGSVLGDFVADLPPVLTLYPPRARRGVDLDYYAAELRSLGERLTDLTGHTPTASDWEQAFVVEDAADEAVRRLYTERWELALSDREFHTALRRREYLLAEDFVEAVEALPRDTAPRPGVGVVLSGILPEPMSVLDLLNDAGAHVADDDLSTGSRRVLPPSTGDEPADPYQRLAARFLQGPADPTRTDPVADRAERLVDLLGRSGARGLVVYTPTFCEPELFYLPLVRERITAAGHPVLHVEFEVGGDLPSQTATRIEAFVESLGSLS